MVLSAIQFATGERIWTTCSQVGRIGLIKAIDNFNTDLDVRFSTYGVPMIIGHIRRYRGTTPPSGCPAPLRDTAYRVLQAKEKFISEHQREPSIEEIAKLLELKREDVVFALDAILDPVSLYEPVYSDGGDTICVMDQVKDSKNTDESWLEHIALKEAMNRLSDRESGTSSTCASSRARPKWRSPPRWASLRPRSPAWKRARLTRLRKICRWERRSFPAPQVRRASVLRSKTSPRRNLLPPGKNKIRAPSAACADGRKSAINQIKKNL